LRSLYEEGFIVFFDWGNWQQEAIKYQEDPTLILNADIETIQKLFITYARAERYCAGVIANLIDKGTFIHLLKRLEILLEEM